MTELLLDDEAINKELNMEKIGIAKFIRKRIGYSYKNDVELRKDLLEIMILTQNNNKLIKDALMYEFLHYEDNKVTKLNDMYNLVTKSLKRYQNVVGGFCIEDMEWTVVDKTSERFVIDSRKHVLMNTTSLLNIYNQDLIWFLDNFIKYVKRQVTKRLDIKYKIIVDDHNRICWILLIMSKTK